MRSWTTLLLAVLGCATPEYQVVIIAETGDPVANGRLWELAILRGGCPQAPLGEDPPSDTVMRVVTWTHGAPGPALGHLSPGQYGFYARVRDVDCAVVWAGCAGARLEEDGEGRIEVPLRQVSGPRCADGLACEGREACDPTIGCVPEEVNDCSDEIDCTSDECVEPTGCSSLPDHGRCRPAELCSPPVGCRPAPACSADEECRDAFACNGDEACANGTCAGGAPLGCDDSVACTVDTCLEPTGCSHRPDHDACGAGELCDPSVGCLPGADCGAGDECAQDGQFCNGIEICIDGRCSGGQEADCRDDVPCTADACSPVLNDCEHVANDAACPDEGACASGGCDAAVGCVYVDRDCDDGDPCTDDTCEEPDGCSNTVRDGDADASTCPEDCNDDDGSIFPGADEVCNGLDDDCDEDIDEGGACDCAQAIRGDVLYLFCLGSSTWSDALADCVDRGGTLAVPLDEDEQTWLADAALSTSTEDWWIGANDSAQEGVWSDPGDAPLSYFAWGEEPADDDTLNCAVLSAAFGGLWDDDSCGSAHAAVCSVL